MDGVTDLFENLDGADGVPQGCFVHNSKPPLAHLKTWRESLCPSMYLFIRPAHQPSGAGRLRHGRLRHHVAISIVITQTLVSVCVSVLPECVVDEEG